MHVCMAFRSLQDARTVCSYYLLVPVQGSGHLTSCCSGLIVTPAARRHIVTHPPVATAPPPAVSAATCFNCGVVGHCQGECPKAPACYLCKRTDHPAVLCPVHRPPGTLGLFGYALDDLGFFQMDLPEAWATPPMTALISVLDGRTASPAIISEELRHLFNPDWDWEVTRSRTGSSP